MKHLDLLYLVAAQILMVGVNLPVWAQIDSPTKGQWMDFPGDRDAFLEVEHNPSLDLKSQITIEAWIYPRRLPQLPQSRWQLVRKGRAYNLAIWRTGIPGQIMMEMNRHIFIFQDGFEVGAWNHVGGGYDKDEREVWFYLNGEARSLKGVERQDLESQSTLKVGPAFDGGMDGLRISSWVRYKADYEAAMTHFEADGRTVLLWHFENRDDSSENENRFEAQGEGLRFAGTRYRSVQSAGKLAVSWGRIKAPTASMRNESYRSATSLKF